VRTNSIIVTDTAETLKRIQQVLKEVDVPAPQVILEVHVLEVDKGLVSDEGIDWGGANGALGSLNGGMRTTPFPFSVPSGVTKRVALCPDPLRRRF